MKNIIILTLLIICSCSSVKKIEQKEQVMITLAKGVSGDMNKLQDGNFVIKSTADLKKYEKLLNGKTSISTVDFSKYIIIASVDVMHNTGGYGIEIVSVKEQNNKLVFTINKSKPAPMKMVTMAFSQPFHIIKTQKTDKEIIFK